ncbi:hypothetical protein [Tamaricihabitans halophyticus]|nr:hypothetical protein [Tamaricihabitans halophyticus]
MAPPQRVYLHIGLPKTGTTSLQGVLWHHRAATVAAGTLYPGADEAAQHRAAMDVHGGRYGGWREPGVTGSWEWLVEQVRAHPGASVISSELLAPASPDEARAVLSALDFAEVHIVCTARDLARQIPSVWQENVKTRHTTSYADFLAALRSGELNPTSQLFWDYQDLPRVLRTWAAALPAERVHVVTVPPRGTPNEVLWQRFAPVIELCPGEFTTDVPQHNYSLGVAETELLRRVNNRLGDDYEWPAYTLVVKEILAEQILSRRPGTTSIALPADDQDWVRETARRHVAELREAGYHVIGDLDELIPPEATTATGDPGLDAEEARLLEVAVDALATLVQRMPTPKSPESRAEQLARTLRELSERYPPALAARRWYWRARSRVRVTRR